jgi:protein-tyrosine-phosphatase
MAETIAESLKEPRFIFNSAGVNPQAIDRATLDFMMKKGVDLSRTVPKALHQIPNLDHYHIIVALSPDAYKMFPQRPRKTIFLDWLVDDPSKKEGDAKTVEAAYEAAYGYLKVQVKDLVNAIIGAENG